MQDVKIDEAISTMVTAVESLVPSKCEGMLALNVLRLIELPSGDVHGSRLRALSPNTPGHLRVGLAFLIQHRRDGTLVLLLAEFVSPELTWLACRYEKAQHTTEKQVSQFSRSSLVQVCRC